MPRKRPLKLDEILHWPQAHHEATGCWPSKNTRAYTVTGEQWSRIDNALRQGLRGLPAGSSLAQLLAQEKGKRHIHQLPPLTEDQILAWAEAHHKQNKEWPTADSGYVVGTNGEKWSALDAALQLGNRGLRGRSSLAQLLDAHRDVRNRKALPPFTEEQILLWADAHHKDTGEWPHGDSGDVAGAPGETWMAVNMALHLGRRGLPRGSSLARLLAQKRHVRNVWNRPALSVAQVLVWAEAFHKERERWPRAADKDVPGAPEETWTAINHALQRGSRGLPKGSSLAQLLHQERGVPNRLAVPRLHRKQILAWALAHHQQTRVWPTADSGPIIGVPGETWRRVDDALRQGTRGLTGNSSLARLLAEHGKKPHGKDRPSLFKKQIVRWAKRHYARTGHWPNVNSGEVAEAPGEKWDLIDNALRQGHRGLKGGSSLAKLLARKCGVRNPQALPALTEEQIRCWAELYEQRTGAWPQYTSGPVADAPGETWTGLDHALRYGTRGLPVGSSLAKLLAGQRAAVASTTCSA